MKNYYIKGILIFLLGMFIILGFSLAGLRRGPEISRSRHGISSPPGQDAINNELRFAVATMVSAKETFYMYKQFAEYIAAKLNRKLSLIIRPTYREVQNLLESGQIDLALVCTGTYLHTLKNKKAKILVTPVFREYLQYRSSIIVLKNSGIRSINDLKGKRMAFSDPDSNTGYIVPVSEFLKRNLTPGKYLSKMIFTGSHDRSLQSVLIGVVDAAAIDDMILKSDIDIHPEISGRIAVIWQSESFGNPPVMVPADLPGEQKGKLRDILLSVHNDPEGKKLINSIGIVKFSLPDPDAYLTALENLNRVENFYNRK